jgi:hypothetical protein
MKTIRAIIGRIEQNSDNAIDEASTKLHMNVLKEFESAYKESKPSSNPQKVLDRNPNMTEITKFDPILAELDKLVLNGTKEMTPEGLRDWLNKAGYSNKYLDDIGFDSLVLTRGTKYPLPAIINRLESKMEDVMYTTTLRNGDTKFEHIVNKHLPKDLEIDKSGILNFETIMHSNEYDLPDNIVEPLENHFGEYDYKSHALYVLGKYKGKPTVHIAETQNDLLQAGLFPDSAIDDLRDEYRALQANMPDEELEPDAYTDWQTELTTLEAMMSEMALDSAPTASKAEARSYVSDKRGFIRDAINKAIQEAKKLDVSLISTPTSEVLVRRYDKAYEDIYKSIYDKEIPKMLRKYAKAHNLKPPYKDGELWILDIDSVADPKLEKRREQIDWWNKM